jgi:hypothetical protein
LVLSYFKEKLFFIFLYSVSKGKIQLGSSAELVQSGELVEEVLGQHHRT